jgi:serine/threonine-protein kinase
VAAGLLGLLFGASLWLLVSVSTEHEPAIGAAVSCAALGAVAAASAAHAMRRHPLPSQ